MKGFATFVLALAFKWIKIIYIFFSFYDSTTSRCRKRNHDVCGIYVFIHSNFREGERSVMHYKFRMQNTFARVKQRGYTAAKGLALWKHSERVFSLVRFETAL